MTTYAFELVLQDPTIDDDACDILHECGCDDATIVTRDGVTRLVFDRESESLETAIQSAAADVRRAGLTIARVELDAPPGVRAG